MELGDYRYFGLILVVLLILLILYRFIRWKKERRGIFADEKFHDIIFGKTHLLTKITLYLYIISIILIIFSFVDIVKRDSVDIEVEHSTTNMLFLVDVSNSMNAQDLELSRLEHAKRILREILSKLNDEKVGIVIFAGEAKSIMPLTTDYSSADIYLDNLSTEMINVQGTDFLLAIEESIKKLNKSNIGNKKVILLSDGEDNEDNYSTAISEAKKNDVVITSVGIGTDEGGTIPEYHFNMYEDYKKDSEGNIIITRRDTKSLKAMSNETGGVYIDGNNIDTATKKILEDIKFMEKNNDSNKMKLKVTEHYYQWILLVSVLLLFFIFFVNPKLSF